MPSLSLQLTIPASGLANLSAALPVKTGGAGNLGSDLTGPGNLYFQWLTFQYNGVNSVRYGMSSKVSLTVPAAANGGKAGFGLYLGPSGSGSQSTPVDYTTMLSDWYFAGVPGDVIDILALQ